ncbi:MAG: thiamine diphosphokinase [Deltaproteobacteria bacterium]|nr:thiamine diphosphokinase [Deltaproteobacteria bacterium]
MLGADSVLLLNGDLTKDDIEHARSLNPKVVFAADGAFHKAIRYGIEPQYVVGDLDSVSGAVRTKNTEFIRINDQNQTDFEKILAFARRTQPGRISIYGISGGEMDHALGNLHSLIKHHQRDGEICFYAMQQGSSKSGFVVREQMDFRTFVGAKVSIFPFPQARVTTQGLTYALSRTKINQTSGVLAMRNIAKSTLVEIRVESGIVLVTTDMSVPCEEGPSLIFPG